MQRTHSNKAKPVHGNRRTGSAQIEFALFLPLLAMMLMMIFTVANATVSRMNVSVVARDQAWRQRYDGTQASRVENSSAYRSSALRAQSGFAAVASSTASNSSDENKKPVSSTEFGHLKLKGSAAIDRVLNHRYKTDFKDLVEGTAEQQSRVFLRLVGFEDRINVAHSVLRGSWDSRAITFQKQSAHKTLMADPKFHRFDASFKLDWLLELLSKASGTSDSLSKLNDALQERTRAIKQILDDIKEYSQKIRDLNARIKSLEQKISTAHEVLDEFQIQRWKRLVKEAQREINYFQRAVRDLKAAKDKIDELTRDF